MCIFLERWYTCPHDVVAEPLTDKQLNPPRPAEPSKPWESWKDGDAATGSDAATTFAVKAPFILVRHRHRAVIRCSMLYNGRCSNDGLRASRTEIFGVPCHRCTGEDPFARDAQPLRTLNGGQILSEMRQSGLRVLDDLIFIHFQHVQQHVVWIVGKELTAGRRWPSLNAAFEYDFVNRCCTEDFDHLSVYDGRPEPSHCECPNMIRPWAHNIARAMRQHEAKATYATTNEEQLEDLSQSLADRGTLDKISNFAAAYSDQAWISFEELHDPPRLTMTSRIRLAAQHLHRCGLEHLGSLFDGDDGPEHRALWDKAVAICEWLAIQWIFYVAIDPGLTPLFRQRYLERMVLPFFDMKPKDIMTGACFAQSSDRYQFGYMHELIGSLKRKWGDGCLLEASQRREVLYRCMKVNRKIAYKNAIWASFWAQSFMATARVASAQAAQDNGACVVCQTSFRVYEDDGDVPEHLRITQTPCCRRPLHAACLLPILRKDRPCPNCRSSFADHGWMGKGLWSFKKYMVLPAGWINCNPACLTDPELPVDPGVGASR